MPVVSHYVVIRTELSLLWTISIELTGSFYSWLTPQSRTEHFAVIWDTSVNYLKARGDLIGSTSTPCRSFCDSLLSKATSQCLPGPISRAYCILSFLLSEDKTPPSWTYSGDFRSEVAETIYCAQIKVHMIIPKWWNLTTPELSSSLPTGEPPWQLWS